MEIYVTGSLNVFNHRTNVAVNIRIVCYDIKELGKQLEKIGMLVVQDHVWNHVTVNRDAHKTTRYYEISTRRGMNGRKGGKHPSSGVLLLYLFMISSNTTSSAALRMLFMAPTHAI